jgi:anaerobic selenocysteine-containing dehydrogenase
MTRTEVQANAEPWKKTACILCSINCGLKVKTDGRRNITKIIGDKDHPVSKGYVCEKAQRLNWYQNATDRLKSPMRRTPEGEYEAVDWDTAIREISTRMNAVRDEFGGDKILYYGGGGQGNHLGGAYVEAWLKSLGVKYRSNALAQEKTGEFWVAGKMFGVGTHGDFENCEAGVFLGKNPWQSHGFPRARAVIQDLAKDPDRCLVVIDPRCSETARKADIHLAVKPGTDAWLIAAMAGIMVQNDWVKHDWLKAHTTGFDEVHPHLMNIQVDEYAGICGIDQDQVADVARRIANAESVSFFEDLGVQMSVHSTLVSYLQRLLWTTSGHYGRKGTANAFVPFLSLGKASKGQLDGKGKVERVSPVVGARIITGLIPCNVIPEEILTDHANRYRAMIIQSGNPAHSLADSQRMREAIRALEFSVAIDVAMTETCRQVDYVLPASSQFEKAEATFFNIEFPDNLFHLRQPLFSPANGTLDEGEIVARLLEASGELGESDYRALRRAARLGLAVFSAVFMAKAATRPRFLKYIGPVLYRTLAPALPGGMEMGAVTWALSLMYVRGFPQAAKRAGFGGPAPLAANRLFKAILGSPSGVVYARSTFDESWKAVRLPENRINLAIPELLDELERLQEGPLPQNFDYPFILSAGERRSETSNTIIRDFGWHEKGIFASLRISPQDAAMLECESGDTLRVTTLRGSAEVVVEVSDMMSPGHVSLPNGTGIDYCDSEGAMRHKGVAPNELTDISSRDFLAGTPWHKHIAAKLERVV